MVAQSLNREFLLAEAGRLRHELDRAVALRERRSAANPDLDDFSDGQIRQVSERLKEVSEEPEGLESAGEGRPEGDAPPTPRPLEDFAYLPRDRTLSLIQSAMDLYLEADHPELLIETPLLDDRRSGEDPVVTDRRLEEMPLTKTATGRRIWGRMEVTHPKIFSDPGWVKSAFAMVYRAFEGRAPFNAKPGGPVEIGNKARLVLVGDWGSGLPRADKVATQMRAVLDAGREERREQHVIHLGDVYYSGWKHEYETRFLDTWPVDPGQDGIHSFSLNGNHDMYCGGGDYFGTCLADPRFAAQGKSSCFSIENDFWQLLALDTSYEDGGLYGDQASWASAALERSPGKRTALLSHHQLFSAHEPGAKILQEKVRSLVESGRIDAWFWGHEHRCIAYKPYRKVGFASCIGHGGIPEYLIMREGAALPAPAAYEYLKVHGNGFEPWDTFGFAVVDLDDDRMEVTYVDEDGNRHFHVPSIDSDPGEWKANPPA